MYRKWVYVNGGLTAGASPLFPSLLFLEMCIGEIDNCRTACGVVCSNAVGGFGETVAHPQKQRMRCQLAAIATKGTIP